MIKNKCLTLLLGFSSFLYMETLSSQENENRSGQLQINIPVKLSKANVVFNSEQLSFVGDLPIIIRHAEILSDNFSADNTQGKIIIIFHTDAGHVTLDDKEYNIFRKIKTGNPYKQLVLNLMNRGVQIELCGATAKANNWVNDYLIPGVKVNTNAMVRLTQLMNEGYVQIKE